MTQATERQARERQDVRLPMRILERINELKRVPRSGWLLAGLRSVESVADHTAATALLAVALAHAVNLDPADEGLEGPVDIGKVAQLALLHDFAESVLTDLPQRATQVVTRPVKHAAEAQVMREVFLGTAGEESTLAIFAEYRDAGTPEARLVHDADKLELVFQAWCYELQGQRNLADYWEGHNWYFGVSARLFEDMVAMRVDASG